MGKIVAIMNRKGGVGKTTTALCLAGGLAARGARVLMVDLDQQHNATKQYGAAIDGVTTVYDLLTDRSARAADGIQRTARGDIIAGDDLVNNVEAEMSGMLSRETMLADALAPVRGEYDWIVVGLPAGARHSRGQRFGGGGPPDRPHAMRRLLHGLLRGGQEARRPGDRVPEAQPRARDLWHAHHAVRAEAAAHPELRRAAARPRGGGGYACFRDTDQALLQGARGSATRRPPRRVRSGLYYRRRLLGLGGRDRRGGAARLSTPRQTVRRYGNADLRTAVPTAVR